MLIHEMKHVACNGILNFCRSVRNQRAELAKVDMIDSHPDGDALVFLYVVFDAARMHAALLLYGSRFTLFLYSTSGMAEVLFAISSSEGI